MSFSQSQLKRLLRKLSSDDSERHAITTGLLKELADETSAKAQSFDNREGLIWVDGEMVDWEDANTHLLTHTLHYGMGVFEGVRAYMVEGVPHIFRLQDHTDRLFDSAKIMGMHIAHSKDEIAQAQIDIIKCNAYQNLPTGSSIYLRPMCYYGSEGMGLQTTNLHTHTMVAAWPWGAYLPGHIDVCFSSFTRHHVGSTMVRSKTNGHYVNSMLARKEAARNGYDESILLDTNGYVSEGCGANLFLVKDRTILTPSLHSCLSGITRKTLLHLCAQRGFEVVETQLTRDDVYIADEAFFTGTAAEVTPIRSVDGKALTNPHKNSVVAQLEQDYAALVCGQIDAPDGWLTPCV